MAHPRTSLRANEKVILDSRPHWWFFVRPISLLVVSIVVAIVVLLRADQAEIVAQNPDLDSADLDFLNSGGQIGIGQNLDSILQILASALILASLLILVVTAVTWYFTHFFVTDQRVVLRAGVLNREGVEIPLDRVNTVFFEQNFIERIVGSGDVLVESAGESGVQRFFDIAHPLAVKDRLRKYIDLSQKKSKPTSAVNAMQPIPAPKTTPITTQIRELSDLHEAQILTSEEFESKKAELLARI